MVASTRTQTGTIEISRYDPITLQLKGESQPFTSTRRTSSTKPPDRKKPGVRKTGGRKLGRGHDRSSSWSDEKKLESLVRNLKLKEPTTQAINGLDDDSTTFWPPVAFGEYEEEGLCPIARADLRIGQWQAILDSHMANMSDLNVERHIKNQLRLARMDRESLDADPDNHVAVNQPMREQAILDRISALETTLASARFEPERENIRGAIAAYQSGQIGYSKKFTLFWAGKLVDEAETYADFTQDRTERLDRYAAQHGPHWLWWESPLWLHPDQRVTALGCQIISRVAQPNGYGHFYIKQGFWKRSHMVHRAIDPRDLIHLPPTAVAANIITTPDGKVDCGGPGPRLIFRSMLDSGSSYPSLYEEDLWALGIYPDHYGAQSVSFVSTANGTVLRRVYEMHVEIAGNLGDVNMVNPLNPVNPGYSRYIGGLCPVNLDDTDRKTGPVFDAQGHEINQRLSGLLAFLAAYFSSTPGKNMIIFGEDRNDVVGAHKLPAARRWMVGLPQEMEDVSYWDKYGDPLITFSHRNGDIIDQDIAPGKSRLTVNPGHRILERSILTDPRGDYEREHGLIPLEHYVDPTERHT
ncbi:MAG: hypothetical protein FRX48_06105 [Lasallia pustulata]|uniref:Uncharacterized protein n=1 Tax=Lasallia pustulata TaxID=136370 RepID=A0A5M8PQ64_9LECA|nr:MAG: hypothetical protein FRX48_06105 [Lasallia pustulata]